MPKQAIIPAGTTTPIAPFVPGTMADGIVYAVSYTHLTLPTNREV